MQTLTKICKNCGKSKLDHHRPKDINQYHAYAATGLQPLARFLGKEEPLFCSDDVFGTQFELEDNE